MFNNATLSSAIAILALMTVPASAADLTVSADFVNGSGKVQAINQAARSIRLEPTPHQGRGWACWWHVKISGITPGETITLTVGPAPWATPDQAHFSLDAGKTWRQTAKGTRSGKQIAYQQKVDAGEALFAWGPPFVPADADALVKEVAQKLNGRDGIKAEVFELCKSREGHSTPALRLTPPPPSDGAKLKGLFVCARQHAWESGGSWVGRGFAEFLESDDPAAVGLRRRTIIYFVPIMDIDNVIIGAGGKNQDPHDHNRDWTDQPVFPAVAAAQKIILELNKAGTFDQFVDLHNPAANNLKPFFFVRDQDQLQGIAKANLRRFLDEAASQIKDPLPLDKEKPSGKTYDKNWMAISGNWVSAHTREGVVALCLETSWNTPHSNIAGYKTVGGQLGRAIAAYLTAGEQIR